MHFERICGIKLESTDTNCRERVAVPDNDVAQLILTVNTKVKQLIYLKTSNFFRKNLYIQPLMLIGGKYFPIPQLIWNLTPNKPNSMLALYSFHVKDKNLHKTECSSEIFSSFGNQSDGLNPLGFRSKDRLDPDSARLDGL